MVWNVTVITTRKDIVGKPPMMVSIVQNPLPGGAAVKLVEEAITDEEFLTHLVPALVEVTEDHAISIMKEFVNIRSLEAARITAELQVKDLGVKIDQARSRLAPIISNKSDA